MRHDDAVSLDLSGYELCWPTVLFASEGSAVGEPRWLAARAAGRRMAWLLGGASEPAGELCAARACVQGRAMIGGATRVVLSARKHGDRSGHVL